MNTSQLKRYAPKARNAFIAAVSAQAARLGITAAERLPAKVEGDVLIIGGQVFAKNVSNAREKLVKRVQAEGFAATMEAVAYTWFNRFAAIRYMELHGYLDHGYRVLSHPDGAGRPEILDHAADVQLDGLPHDEVIALKLDGTQDERLYRLLLKAQCNALHRAMPFLFERIGGADELLLPANLLHTDSLIRAMVDDIDEDAWQHIEIIGWLYQFYISEKKDQVIGKVVKSEDIPAATQLFTPNWIVKYMVQNSLGAQWLATYPHSPLKAQMDYYIEPAEQTDEVNAQLAAITPSALDPEALTLIDPACGSGHILVEAYDLFRAIYLERGHRRRDVAKLILEKNLYGLDIDGRAAQLTGFALMMKGRADDRRLFERDVTLNVMALVDSAGFDAEAVIQGVKLSEYGLAASDVVELKALFEHATTFGSLIQVPAGLAGRLAGLRRLSEVGSGDLFLAEAMQRLGVLVRQGELLAARYDAVVANPPYMGGRFMNPVVKRLAAVPYPDAKSDLFACFIERGYTMANDTGYVATVTMESWLFLSSFEQMRKRLLTKKTICTVAHLSAGIVCGFGTVASVIRNSFVLKYLASYSRTSKKDLNHNMLPLRFPVQNDRLKNLDQMEFDKIPGSPIAYWASAEVRNVFERGKPLELYAPVRQGMATGNNARFLRNWFEVDSRRTRLSCNSVMTAFESGGKWFPYNKGGGYRKWNGNSEFLICFDKSSYEILRTVGNHCPSQQFYFQPSVTWSFIGMSFAARQSEAGFVFDVAGSSCFPDILNMEQIMGFLGSKLPNIFLGATNPTLNYQAGNIRSLPILKSGMELKLKSIISNLVTVARSDWDVYERSWNFKISPILMLIINSTHTLQATYTTWITKNRATIAEMKRLEEENNRFFINAYGLQDELTPDVPLNQITLTINPAYRYSSAKLSEAEQWTRFRHDTMKELISYAIGCMMGRYSLDEPGLIYANSGNIGFDTPEHRARYASFPADDDGIIPLTDVAWFAEDDACQRLVDFIATAWDVAGLEENLTFVANNLAPKKTEASRETLRRYLCTKFFKDHLKTYKKRPIYWLFSSGRQKAFQCLVYLHRYNAGTLARMRSAYVIPLQGKMAARMEKLRGDIAQATSTAHRKRLEKERTRLEKQHVELLGFDEKLRHFADRRIELDLDDGVKLNYGKFGDLLAEVKAVHGKKAVE